MIYRQCKCGEHKSWSSMGVPGCCKCKKCGSDLAEGPNAHKEPLEHRFSLKTKVETDNGEAELTRCEYCLKTRKQIEKENE